MRRAVYVVQHPFAVAAVPRPGAEEFLMHLGDRLRAGRASEAGVVQEDGTYVIIHVIGLREKAMTATTL